MGGIQTIFIKTLREAGNTEEYMFTGIIDHCGTIIKIENAQQSKRFWVQTRFSELVLGESIAVDGVCLTVTQFQDAVFCCDISPETRCVTTIENMTIGQSVNLERALQISSRMGGHMVMGHVDQVCKISQYRHLNEFVEMHVSGLNELTRQFVIKKGSVAVNGVSLTVNDVGEDSFSVMLVPHTLERSNLALLLETATVNVEFDMIARLIVSQCQHYLNGRDQ